MRITDLLKKDGIVLGAAPADKRAAIDQLVALLYLFDIWGKLKLKLSRILLLCSNTPEHKFMLRHGFNIVMGPAGYPSVYIGVTALQNHTDSHDISSQSMSRCTDPEIF